LRSRLTLFFILIILLFFVSTGFAGDSISVFVGTKEWLSTGDNKWNIAGNTSGTSPNVLSELEYMGLDSMVTEIYGGLLVGNRGVLTIGYGFGSMDGGTYRDSDYLSDNRQDMFSLSTGKSKGEDLNSLYYMRVDYKYRLYTNQSQRGHGERYLDILFGYQKWHEDITFTDGVQEVGGTLGSFSGLNSRYVFDWTSVRVGLEGALPVHGGFTFKWSGIAIPYTKYEGEGIWNLRTDFEQDPSFKHEADWGYGMQTEASLIYRHVNLSVELGYRYWYIKSGDGLDTTYFSNGTIGVTKFNEATSERKGPFVGVAYVF